MLPVNFQSESAFYSFRANVLRTINSVKPIAVAEFASIPGKCLPGRGVGREIRELGTSRAAAHRDQGLEMGVLSLQLGECGKASLFAVYVLLEVAPVVQELSRERSLPSLRGMRANLP